MLQMKCAIIILVSTVIQSYQIDASQISAFNKFIKNPAHNIRSGGHPKFPSGFNTLSSGYSFSNRYVSQYFITHHQQPQTVIEPANVCGQRSIDYKPKRHAKIIGGNIAPYGAFPWQVEIQIYNYEKAIFEHHCGAAVIGERFVLTAAHCTEVSQQPYLHLVTGNYDLNKVDGYERRFRIESIIMHPEFRQNGPYSNDLSIIKVASINGNAINFNTHVKPICLPKQNNLPTAGTWCSVSGWGAQIPEDNKSLASVLRVASVPLLSLDTCRMSDVNGGRSQSILDTMICAGLLQGGIDACNGDSGGPLACQHNGTFYLTGIVSWGDGCAKKNRPGVYTRVDAFIDWIEQTMKRMSTGY